MLLKIHVICHFLRFCYGIQPILVGMNVKDVRHRSRFIWTNIKVFNPFIENLRKENICLKKIKDYQELGVNEGILFMY